MTSIGWCPSDQSEWLWRSPRRSAWAMSAGSRPASAASISPASSRSSGSMNGSPRKAYASASVAERPQLGVGAGQRLAVIADPEEALLRQAPALVPGHRPEPDVVLLGPGEMDAIRAGLAGRHDHQVDLRSAHQPDGRLVAATIDDRVDEPERGERVDQRRGLVRLGQQVEVADGLAAAAERAGRLDRMDAGRRRQDVDQPVDQRLGRAEEHPVEPIVELGDPLEDEHLRPRRHPANVAQPALLGRPPKVVDGLDPELRVELADGLGPEARDLEQGRRATAAPRPGAARRTRGGRSWRARPACR